MRTSSDAKKLLALKRVLVLVCCIAAGALITLSIVGPEGARLSASVPQPVTAGDLLLAFILKTGHQLGSFWMTIATTVACLVAYGVARVIWRALCEVASGFYKNTLSHVPALRQRKAAAQGTHPSSFNE